MWERLRHRIEEKCSVGGLLYPWWVPLLVIAGEIVCVLLSLGFRDALWSPNLLWFTMLLVVAAPFVQIGLGHWLPWYVDSLGAVVAATWLLWSPIGGEMGALDAAPALLMFATAEATARDGLRPGAVVGVVSAALIGVAAWTTDLAGAGVHVLTIVLGYDVGAMLLWQMRALAAEREAREQAWQQATLAERQRIAREIHDLVAHSLSVTLLHLTGARHALRDVEGAEAEEVDGALADAERVGRQAIAEIRRTVGNMADGPAETRALPGAAGIPGLVQQMRDAGLSVNYAESGDPDSLPRVVGLGLHRIVQESLTNVAKHAATSPVDVELAIDRGVRLTVRNQMVGADPLLGRAGLHGGSGLAGMEARAEQLGGRLRAGPVRGDWVVDLRVPADRLVRVDVSRPEVVQ